VPDLPANGQDPIDDSKSWVTSLRFPQVTTIADGVS
jgi:hypothetical protein